MCNDCKKKGKYYITTAITYTSGRPHIGNTYEIILTDAIARYKRQKKPAYLQKNLWIMSQELCVKILI